MTRADRIEAVLTQEGPLSGDKVARAARMRKADALATLHSEPRFARTGKRRASLWYVVAPGSLDAAEAAARWNCDEDFAAETIALFVEHGLLASQNGNGRVAVTDLGLALSDAIRETLA